MGEISYNTRATAFMALLSLFSSFWEWLRWQVPYVLPLILTMQQVAMFKIIKSLKAAETGKKPESKTKAQAGYVIP